MGIEGKIAKILNTRELVINRGADDGVMPDMEFAVMEPQLNIIDPDTQELLGDLEREKIRVRVFETHPKFSLARTYETYQAPNPDSLIPRLAGAMAPFITQVKRLSLGATHLEQEGFANVREGDTATQIPVPFSNVTTKDKK